MSEEEIRLDQTKKVFEAIVSIINEGSCSYRGLIYGLLGFDCEAYCELISGLTITNAIVELEELRDENCKLSELWKDSQVENRQLKGVLKEIREYMEVEEEAGTLWTVRSTNVILEIIDKAGIGKENG
jgi:hypothetical protein